MATLHTVNKSPFERSSLDSCLRHLSAGDSVLLIEDAVIGARKGSSAAAALTEAMQRGAVYALSPDLAARGLTPSDIVSGVALVDYGGFVDLVAQHDRSVAWL